MSHADPAALATLLPLLRQLRDIKGLREVRPGVFHSRGAPFVHFHTDSGALYADLKKLGASGFDRYPLATPPNGASWSTTQGAVRLAVTTTES